ncbi:MAG: GIY-YIG nuclease family protein [Chlamydiales bacterium]|nr:GIY-YIG nuclease family protein [Chlamydiales bacterium]
MTSSNKWEVYIIETKSKKLYTGITNNLERRFDNHQKRQKGARFFYFSSPEKVVFRETHPNRSEALKRECAIKKLSRKEKIALIEQSNKKYS